MGETSVTRASAGDARRSDGRSTRAARTRAAVVEALLTLNDQGNLRPTARDIAEQAGVSLRSLYVHFDDLEALIVEAGRRHTERLVERLPPLVTDGDLDLRLDAFLARRRTIHEFGAGVRRAAQLQEPFSPVLKEALAKGRQALRSDVKAAFAAELAAAADVSITRRRRLLDALDIVTSPAAWESLRIHQDLSVDEAAAQVRDMVLAFIHAWVPAAAGDRGTAAIRTPPPDPG